MHHQHIEEINELIMGEILYDDNIIMNSNHINSNHINYNHINYNQNLGNHIIITTENGTDLIYHKSSSGSRYIPEQPKDDTVVYTENQPHNSEPEEKKQLVDLINEMHTPGTKSHHYLKTNRMGQFYFGSLAVVGLFIVYRMIQKTR